MTSDEIGRAVEVHQRVREKYFASVAHQKTRRSCVDGRPAPARDLYHKQPSIMKAVLAAALLAVAAADKTVSVSCYGR